MGNRLLRGAVVAFAFVALVAGFFVLIWQGPWWLDRTRLLHLSPPQATTAVNGFRTALAASGVGIAAVAGLVYTARTHWLSREGQVADRYTKAIDQLASGTGTVRLGGVYALERIMRDSPKDHSTVVAVLAAFVRQRAPRAGTSAGKQVSPPADGGARKPDQDVEAAIMVLARRPSRKTSQELKCQAATED